MQAKVNEHYILRLPEGQKVMLFDIDITSYYNNKEVVCTGFVKKLSLTPVLVRCDEKSTIDVAVSPKWLHPISCMCELQILMLRGCICGGK